MKINRWVCSIAGTVFLVAMIARIVPVRAQILHANGPLPSFEVVSVRPWKPAPAPLPAPSADGTPGVQKRPMKVDPGGGGGGGQRTDRVHTILPTDILIKTAYGLLPSAPKLSGSPDWVQQEQYEIQAKIEGALFAAMQTMTPAQQREQVALMEQSLLADRFKLKVHFEMRDMPVYALTVAKGGAKLTPAKEGESSHMADTRENEQGTETVATAVTMDQLAHSSLLFDGKAVVDQTGLKGAYDFALTWASERQLTAGADAPALFAAMQEQLGLRIVQTKAPVEVIVIDHIERPTEN